MARVMDASFNYPVFFTLENHACLIVGFGTVGQRKLQTLLDCKPSRILVLDKIPEIKLSNIQKSFFKNGICRYADRAWRDSDIEQASLVFACTNDKEENRKISIICRERGKFCNNITEPELGDFIVPAVISKQPLTLAISTNGASPLLAGKVKKEFSGYLDKYVNFAEFMEKIRKRIIFATKDANEHKKLFSQLCSSPLIEFLADGNYSSAMVWINEKLSGENREIVASALEEMLK